MMRRLLLLLFVALLAAPLTPPALAQWQLAEGGSPLNRRGLGMGTIVEGKLYLIVFDSPATYFFDRDRAEVEAIMASATF